MIGEHERRGLAALLLRMLVELRREAQVPRRAERLRLGSGARQLGLRHRRHEARYGQKRDREPFFARRGIASWDERE
ncbi:hypothetical protein [Burkholderia pseudomallei]|uniref:hypothetical protein n=1 Tax=Burkholderia pseudomallei TaxID=28450 RepID=UPI000A6528E6